MLNDLQRELKRVSYHLSNVISDGDSHVVLEKGKAPIMIEVIESTHIHAKVPCKGMLSPCKVMMNYLSKGNVKIFMSQNHKMP